MKQSLGFTLLELLITVAVVAILAVIAYPSYLDSIRKARRADGIAAVSNVQQAQQKLRASCRFYAGAFGGSDVCGASAADSTILAPANSPDGRYVVSISNASGTSYTLTATPQGDQANDDEGGVTCTLVLTVNAANPRGVRTPAACWD